MMRGSGMRKLMPLRLRFRFTPPQERCDSAVSVTGCVKPKMSSRKTRFLPGDPLIGIVHI